MTYKVLMALLVSLHLMKIVIAVTSKPDQTASEEITLFKLTNPMESKSVTENPCKGLNEGSDIALVLTNRNLVDFPVCLPKNIEILDLSINNLTIIQERDISELSNLLILRLKYNQIRNIYWSTEVLTKLLQLDLSYNYISTVPKCIMLKEMKWLSLAGNPISQIHPFAFSCFPNLQFLNLSSTLLGNISSESISESAFALNVAGKKESRTSLDLLDLSGTFLSRGNSLWSKDIPNLKKLFIMNMIYMESLEEDLLKSFPQLQFLICSGSNALNSVASEVFENAPNLRYLDFQNCNLSTLSLWNISVANISINLQGNPLNCSCELSWVFSDHVSLISANETFCSIASGGQPLFSVIDQCNFNVKTNVTDNQTRTETTIGPHNSAITTTTANYLQGTSKQDVLNILSSQEGDQIAFIPGSIKVSKTTGNSDSTTPLPSYLSTTSAIWQTSTHIGNAVQNITDDTKLSTTVGVSAVKVSTTIPPITKHQSLPITAMVHHTTQFNKEPANKGSPSYEDIPIEFDSDYNYEDEQQSKTTVKKQIVSCNYHPCRHLQTPCFELQQLTECYCPGLSGEDIIPDPPRLRDVSEVTDTSVQIKWCAPSSVVEKYRIVYHPEGSRNHTVIDNIYVTTRLYSLYKLLPHTTYQVCVIAVNKRGSSDTTNDNLSRIPCTTFTTKPNYVVIMAALSAVGGLLLVTIIVLSVCLYKTCKSNMVNQYDTHLVSYKNPAFDYQLNIPTYH